MRAKKSNKSKLVEIMSCLCEPEISLWHLRELCLTNGGLLNDSVRQNAWPKLLCCQYQSSGRSCGNADAADQDESDVGVTVKKTLPLSDYNIIDADSERCKRNLVLAESYEKMDEKKGGNGKAYKRKLRKRQKRLACLIKSALELNEVDEFISEHDYDSAIDTAYNSFGRVETHKTQNDTEKSVDIELRYYQGFHDIASVILSSIYVSGNDASFDKAVKILHRIAKCFLRDALRVDFKEVINTLQLAIFPLLGEIGDTFLLDYLSRSGQEPFFALGWIITWFSHDIQDTKTVKRIFDACLASHPTFPIYLSIAMILHPYNRRFILNEKHIDFASVYKRLCSLPKHSCPVFMRGEQLPVPIQELIDAAISYMRRIPPRNILKTASSYRNGELMPIISSARPSMIFPPLRWRDWAMTARLSSDWIVVQRQSMKGLSTGNTFIKDTVNDENDKNYINEGDIINVSTLTHVASGLSLDEMSDNVSDSTSHFIIAYLAASALSLGLYMINNNYGILMNREAS